MSDPLDAAYRALDEGRTEQARGIAQAALADVDEGDITAQARALSCLAHCDRVGSKLRRASESARRAASLFEQAGDVAGEMRALATLSQVTVILGRNEEAIEAAILCTRLGDTKTPEPMDAIAYNTLGLAYCWSGDHDRADDAFETAVAVARRCDPPISICQLRLNQAWVEASRLVDERYQTGTMKSLHRMAALMQECWQLEAAGEALSILPGLQRMARTIFFSSSSLLASWQGDVAAASSAIESATHSLSGTLTWLDAFVRWCAAELAWARGDWPATERELTAMRDMALAVEHEQLACMAQMLLAQVYELQGKHAETAQAYRALRRRERRVITGGLGSRESLVSWRLGARKSERHLERALEASKRFERWSLEDALTGIANRRCFEQAIALQLALAMARDTPLTVAMIDVDKFKSINDRHTHSVGDRVLKTLAAILNSEIRESDHVARWAGDEFVILFDEAPEFVAWQACDRIRSAVAGFDWEAIAPGLRVSVSIGTSEARPGDTAQSLFQRSDESMYRKKSTGTSPVM